MIEQPQMDTAEIERQQRLADFIKANEGKINFEQYMRESLYGQGAYYQESVLIGNRMINPEMHFSTYALSPLFAYLVVEYVKEQDLGNGFSFVELAGGNGVFKQNFLNYAKEAGIDISYISVDISEKLIRQQAIAGGMNIEASALTLPMADQSIEGMIFANELVDALPFRVVRVIKNEEKFVDIEELHYSLSTSGQIQAEWLPPSPEVTEYWQEQVACLQERGFSLKRELANEQVLCFGLHEKTLIEELNRVLAKGKIVLIDYGFDVDKLYDHSAHLSEPRQYPRNPSRDLKDISKGFCTTDITYNVNFSYLITVAEKLGLKVELFDQSEFFSDRLPDDLRKLIEEGSDEEYISWVEANNAGGMFPLGPNSSFKVLIISKK